MTEQQKQRRISALAQFVVLPRAEWEKLHNNLSDAHGGYADYVARKTIEAAALKKALGVQ